LQEKALREKETAMERRRVLGKKGSQRYRDALRDAPKLLSGEAVINEAKVRARIQEIGPQFTMRLQWLQHGTFDKQMGEYEWAKNKETGKNRRQFDL
jgi:rRNA maturation protein Rpf1